MSVLRGLRVVAVSTAALATSITGIAVYSSSVASETVGVPDAVVSAESEAPRRAVEVSRSEDRPALDEAAAKRAEALSVAVAKIAEHDAALKADAAAKVAAEQAAAAAAAAEADRVKQQLGYDPATKAPKEIARQIMASKYGWGADEFTCYDNIIMRESRWDPFADNPASSAYGIPQALPGKRMASHGADWRTNPVTQIRWGLDYVKERYGSPCRAWSFKRSHGWY